MGLLAIRIGQMGEGKMGEGKPTKQNYSHCAIKKIMVWRNGLMIQFVPIIVANHQYLP
jgi:hypothetical protein